MTRHPRRTVAAVLLALGCAGALATASPAVVPPRDCGTVEARGKVWRVKADQVRCRPARRYAREYIRTRDAPPAYRCRRGPDGSSLFAQCTATSYSPDRVIYIIRRS